MDNHDDEINFVEGLYDDANDQLRDVYKQQQQNRDELLKKIANIMLTYTIIDAVMSIGKDEQNKLSDKFLNLLTGFAKNQGSLTNKITTDILKDTVNNTFDYYSYNANLKDVEKIINNNYKGKHFSSRVWKNEKAVGELLHSQTQDFLQGKVNVNQIKNNIKEAYDNNAYEVKRLVETEVSRCQNEAFDRFCIETDVKKVKYNAVLEACEKCRPLDGKIYDFDKKPDLPKHPLCRCFYEIADNNYKNDVLKYGKDGIINTQEKLLRKETDSRKNLKFISDATFDKLTIKARKNGAFIMRGTEEVEKHLNDLGAAAANIGDVLLFRKDVCISDVLEETYHFEQNLKKLNDDKGEPLRTILNEIDAKEYLINNYKKYKIPRNEIDITKKQLESYKNQLKKVMKG